MSYRIFIGKILENKIRFSVDVLHQDKSTCKRKCFYLFGRGVDLVVFSKNCMISKYSEQKTVASSSHTAQNRRSDVSTTKNNVRQNFEKSIDDVILAILSVNDVVMM